MSRLKRIVKSLLQGMTGFDVERVGTGFFLIEQKRREGAWFSHNAQLRAFIEKESVDLVLDVGANEGQFAQKIRSFYSGKILSFEPVQSAFSILKKAASSDPDWHVYNCALGSHECSQLIYISNDTVFSSLLKSNNYSKKFGKDSLVERSEAVSVRRVDKLLEEIAPEVQGNRIFLKMDTQGYDTAVFEGLGTAIERIVLLQSEVSLIPLYDGMSHWIEVISTYERKGFGVVGMFPVNRDPGSRVIEYDCLLRRKGSYAP